MTNTMVNSEDPLYRFQANRLKLKLEFQTWVDYVYIYIYMYPARFIFKIWLQIRNQWPQKPQEHIKIDIIEKS